MSSNGVILQHRAELIAYLFVDRSDNLLIGNYTKKSLSDDRQLQLGKSCRYDVEMDILWAVTGSL